MSCSAEQYIYIYDTGCMCHYKKGPRKTMSDKVKRGTPLSAYF